MKWAEKRWALLRWSKWFDFLINLRMSNNLNHFSIFWKYLEELVMVIRVVDVEGGLPLDVMRVVKIIMVVGVVREANVQYLITQL